MGSPRERNESSQIVIDNPNLPEGFEITSEMLEDPTVVFFLQNYCWAQETIQEVDRWGGKRILTMSRDKLAYYPWVTSVMPWSYKNINIDFENFDLYGTNFVYGSEKISADHTDEDRKRILEYLLPEDEDVIEQFRHLFVQTDTFQYFLRSTSDEIDHIVWLVTETQYDDAVRKMIAKELETIVGVLQSAVDHNSDKK